MDYTLSVADCMSLYGIPAPVPHSLERATILVSATQQTRRAVTGLRNFGDIS